MDTTLPESVCGSRAQAGGDLVQNDCSLCYGFCVGDDRGVRVGGLSMQTKIGARNQNITTIPVTIDGSHFFSYLYGSQCVLLCSWTRVSGHGPVCCLVTTGRKGLNVPVTLPLFIPSKLTSLRRRYRCRHVLCLLPPLHKICVFTCYYHAVFSTSNMVAGFSYPNQ